MAARLKNPAVVKISISIAICPYQLEAIEKIDANVSSVIRGAIDDHLNLAKPSEYIKIEPSRQKKHLHEK